MHLPDSRAEAQGISSREIADAFSFDLNHYGIGVVGIGRLKHKLGKAIVGGLFTGRASGDCQ